MIKEIQTRLREWAWTGPENVEKASRKERLKRDGWMFISTLGTLAVVGFAIASVSGILYGQFASGDVPIEVRTALAILMGVVGLYVDSKWVFPWGVERFDLVIPWQFREAEHDGD